MAAKLRTIPKKYPFISIFLSIYNVLTRLYYFVLDIFNKSSQEDAVTLFHTLFQTYCENYESSQLLSILVVSLSIEIFNKRMFLSTKSVQFSSFKITSICERREGFCKHKRTISFFSWNNNWPTLYCNQQLNQKKTN